MSSISVRVDQILNPDYLWIALWLGLGLLACSVVILMVSRWGQARPLSKCVVLSIFAHVLLVGFAYLIRLFDPPPNLGLEPSVAITLETPAAAEGEQAEDPVQPWEKFPTEVPVVTEQVALDRQLTATAEPDRADVTVPDGGDQPRMHLPSSVAQEPVASEVPGPPNRPTEPTDIAAAPKISEAASSSQSHAAQTVAGPPDSTSPEATIAGSEDNLEAKEGGGPPGLTATAATAGAGEVIRRDDRQLPAVYQSRFAKDRLQLAIRRGGSAATESAVQRALDFLGRTQKENGHWDASELGAGRESMRGGQDRKGAGHSADAGITALSTLAIMANGNTHLQGPYRQNVQLALEYLISQQAANGSLAGSAGDYAAMYCHAMSLLTLGEAFALTGDERLEPAIMRAVQYSVAGQHPQSGGWRYKPWEQRPDDLGDMSQFGWQVMSLYSVGKSGISVPARTWQGASRFLESCARGNYAGLSSYQSGLQHPVTPSMTAEALFVRFLINRHHRLQSQEAADYLIRFRPGRGEPDYYLWYYGTLALFQLQDHRWQSWNAALTNHLLREQVAEGVHQGSWDPNGVWGSYGGRAYTTALAVLSLQVYYRYLPLLEAPP